MGSLESEIKSEISNLKFEIFDSLTIVGAFLTFLHDWLPHSAAQVQDERGKQDGREQELQRRRDIDRRNKRFNHSGDLQKRNRSQQKFCSPVARSPQGLL